MEWVLGGLVVPLIRSHFYVTETETTRCGRGRGGAHHPSHRSPRMHGVPCLRCLPRHSSFAMHCCLLAVWKGHLSVPLGRHTKCTYHVFAHIHRRLLTPPALQISTRLLSETSLATDSLVGNIGLHPDHLQGWNRGWMCTSMKAVHKWVP